MLSENVLEQFSLTNRVAIITGGGQGLGREMALALSEVGANIVIAARRIDSALLTKKEIESNNVKCLVVKTDIRNEFDVISMVNQVMGTFGKIDILVNNAGIWRGDDAEKVTSEDWREVIDVNLTGAFIVSREVGKVMLENEKGNIINIASMSGLIVNTPQNQCAYNASKGGLIMLTKSLATEWAKKGIRVNTICPGYIRTEMSEDRYQRKDPAIERWFSMTPMGRSGLASELKGIVVFLASDASSFMTGSTILIDGGYTSW